jgi:hypothetical protein
MENPQGSLYVTMFASLETDDVLFRKALVKVRIASKSAGCEYLPSR